MLVLQSFTFEAIAHCWQGDKWKLRRITVHAYVEPQAHSWAQREMRNYATIVRLVECKPYRK